MQLAPASTPVYVGLRVSTDREFSAPMYADQVRPLAATTADAAIHEARGLLTAGAFDAARSVAILQGGTGNAAFSAGSLVELGFGGSTIPVGLSVDDSHFEYWLEPAVAAVVDQTGSRPPARG